MLPFNFTKVKFCSAKNDKFTACSFNFFTFFAKIAPHVAYYAKKQAPTANTDLCRIAWSLHLYSELKCVCYFKYELFGLLPSDAGVGYGLAVHLVVGDLLRAVLNVALDHKTLKNGAHLGGVSCTVEYLFCNSRLLEILLKGL